MSRRNRNYAVSSADGSTQRLLAMLEVKRPHNSESEEAFIRHFLMPLGCNQDAFGNLWLRVGSDPEILWSSHTDSCHRTAGLQNIACADGIVRLAPTSTSNCLGADDAAGVWLMTEMIAAGIPGLYVFHRGEERGGLGSRHFVARNKAIYEDLKAAIAFDRRGTSSVITHQSGARCCSEIFAGSLAAAIGLGHRPDPTGSFTDTANYVDAIGECTNISVGYEAEHSARESLDITYLCKLRDRMLSIDLTSLRYARKAGEAEAASDFDLDFEDPQDWSPRRQSLTDLVAGNPEAVAEFLYQNGVTARDLYDYITYEDAP